MLFRSRCSELIQENIITDRTVIDVMAFTENAQSIEIEHKAAFIDYAHNFIPEYDWIFHVTSEGVNIEDNNVRTTDAIYRKQIEHTIRSLISENLFKIKNFGIISGSVEDRIKQFKSYLSL